VTSGFFNLVASDIRSLEGLIGGVFTFQ
jgi:hypothetical protein